MENAERLRDAMTHTQALAEILMQTLEKFQILDRKIKQDMEELQDMDMVHALERIMARDQAKVLELKQGLEQLQLFHRSPLWLLAPVLTLFRGKSLDLKHALEQVSAQVHLEALEVRQAVEEMCAQAQAQGLFSEDILERKKIVGCMEAKMESPAHALRHILEGL